MAAFNQPVSQWMPTPGPTKTARGDSWRAGRDPGRIRATSPAGVRPMKHLKPLAALCLATLSVAGTAAHAADNGLYLGLGVANSSYDVGNALDDSDTGYKAIGGLRLLDSFGIEANYADHGKARLPSGAVCAALAGVNCPDTANLDAKTLSAFAVGYLDFPLVDLFGKAGLSYTDTSLNVRNLPSIGGSDERTDFAWGFGAQAHFLSLAVRAEFERFKVFGDRKLDVISASFIYTFL
jgi:hypothetical protein